MPRKDASEPSKTELRPLTAHDVSMDLDPPLAQPKAPPSPSSIKADRNVSRTNHWRNNPYAAGMVEPTWADEVGRVGIYGTDDDDMQDSNANGPNRSCCEDAGSENMDPTCGCLVISGVLCGRMGFKRLGNMVILKERTVEVVDNPNDIEASSIGSGHRFESEIVYIVGPYWPMMLGVTYPLILGVSYFTAANVIFVKGSEYNPGLAVIWSLLTFALCYSLFRVAFKNPGILKKHASPPKYGPNEPQWRWDDRVQSYAPRRAVYDTDCAVVIEEFDHTCPWTGTAIGKGNMPAFQAFIVLVFLCLIMDVILLTSSSMI
eukprot:200475_1